MGETMLLSQMGSKIRDLRKKRKMTQNDLAFKCEFEKARLSRIETGQTNPTIRSLFKISTALEVSIAELFPEHG
jgi:transcriptional regulator with XRE-family HTH domain